jgi:hypothetical protein
MMNNLFALLYVCAVSGVIVYLVMLATRLVRAHERMADSLERIAAERRSDGSAR